MVPSIKPLSQTRRGFFTRPLSNVDQTVEINQKCKVLEIDPAMVSLKGADGLWTLELQWNNFNKIALRVALLFRECFCLMGPHSGSIRSPHSQQLHYRFDLSINETRLAHGCITGRCWWMIIIMFHKSPGAAAAAPLEPVRPLSGGKKITKTQPRCISVEAVHWIEIDWDSRTCESQSILVWMLHLEMNLWVQMNC